MQKKLEEKLINLYIDYHNENEIEIVSMYMLIPQNVGEDYEVTAIFGAGDQKGASEFMFGKREQEYDYWHPDCMGPCNFSDAFKAKYPQIVEKAQ